MNYEQLRVQEDKYLPDNKLLFLKEGSIYNLDNPFINL